jgi:PilZ domain
VLERRVKSRISEPFLVTVSGVDKAGEAFAHTGVLENMSSSGIYLKVPRQLEPGTELRLIVSFSMSSRDAPGATIRGKAVRVDRKADSTWGLAIEISDYAFI